MIKFSICMGIPFIEQEQEMLYSTTCKNHMLCAVSLANRMYTHGYKTVQGTRINFPLHKSLISALISTAHKMCLVMCAEAIYSNTPLPKDRVKSFTLQEQCKVKPTWYLEGSWTALDCTTEANIISVVVSWIADEMSSYCTNLMN